MFAALKDGAESTAVAACHVRKARGEAPSFGQPISVYAPNSTGAQAYAALAHEVLEGDGIKIPVLS